MSSTRNIIAWILQILLAVAFIASGGNKLLHLADTVKGFGGMGFTRPAALGLMLIMIGAAYVHATKIPGGLLPNGFPALGLLVLLVVVYLLRRPTTTRA
jgi:uncharacterized membrane protein YphA (DoxX/SURF4 family)